MNGVGEGFLGEKGVRGGGGKGSDWVGGGSILPPPTVHPPIHPASLDGEKINAIV